jgi:AraC-like DNA-binding protein
MTIKQPTKAVVFELSNEMIKQVSDKVSYEYEIDQNLLSQNNFYIGSKNDALNETLCRITRKFLQKEKHSEYLIDLYAQELVYHLIQNKGIHQVLNTECNNPINRAIKYMKDNYTQPISMQQLAYDLNMSQANFSQYFKKITRITPNQYLTKIKLEKAQELLKETSVTEVAFELGYANISHFILLFKRMYGVTPKQYQMMHHFHCRADKSMSLVE